ncbi:MAG TPA: hypothetical protein VFU31_29900 [Candidatus Binatia bacterium]|nr:hypothetical protein [Candidatus Binatia bacterium]
MKVLDRIDRKRLEQVPVISRFAIVEPEYEALPPAADRPEHWRWKYGFEIHCNFTGPREASDHMADHARRLIAREIFGEITDDLFELQRTLLEESYRRDGDPAMTIINNLIRKVRGERV